MRAVVVGLAVTGRAAARALLRDGYEVVAVDDRPTADTRAAAESLGLTLVEAPDGAALSQLAAGSDLVVVSPGVPAHHPVFRLEGPEVISEVELGWRRAKAPVVAVTGTNGKTTVVTMVSAMLEESGLVAPAAGNIGLPLVEAADLPADVIVVEVSSFQLALTRRFRPHVATWLNLSPDHLDWHPDMGHYAASKARIWANQEAGDTAVVNADDQSVMSAATTPATAAPARLVTFGGSQGDYRVDGGDLVGPAGRLAGVAELPRSLPHDVSNALAALATALAAGASPEGCHRALTRFRGLPHRVSLVGESRGVRFFDDSKATTPASVLAALAGFDKAVLIAGGRNKGLDLSVLGTAAEKVRSVVAIGEAAPEVEAAFAGLRPTATASTMKEAVRLAAGAARPGDVVLLSPGCASFDWYRSYSERGDDFAAEVAALDSEGAA